MAAFSHRKMAPSHGGRSTFRLEFCRLVEERARKIAAACIREQAFRACFDDTRLSGIRSALNAPNCIAMKELYSALSELETILKQFSRDCTEDPLLVLVFDEVSSLLDKEGRGGRYIALNRLISCISMDHSVWYFFLSTESKPDQILPPDYGPRDEPAPDRPSWRGEFRLKRYPPFTEFTVDIPDVKEGFLLTPEKEVMSRFASPEHMARFGRPL